MYIKSIQKRNDTYRIMFNDAGEEFKGVVCDFTEDELQEVYDALGHELEA